MCGIFGFATNETNHYQHKRKEVFTNGLFFQMPRGYDATGIAGVSESFVAGKKEITIKSYKRALHYLDFMGTKYATQLMNKMSDYYYVIGHVRQSTRGAGVDANAHPFEYGHITLAHNGTVAYTNLTKATEDVDSAHIAATMAKVGEIETLEKLDGGFALVWYNSKDDSLNFARNDRKPLAMAFEKGKGTVYYASEYSTLWNVLVRNGIEIEGPIQIPRPGIHYKFYKEDVRAFDKEGFKQYTRPSYPLPKQTNNGGGGKATVHTLPGESTTTNGAHASDVKPLVALPPPKDTPTGGGTRASINSAFVNPSDVRIKEINVSLDPFYFKYGQPLILKPTGMESWSRQPDKCTMYFDRLVGTPSPLYTFVQVFANTADYEKWKAEGKCAMQIRNVMKPSGIKNEPLKIVVIPEPDIQSVLEREATAILKLDAHGFLEVPAKEVPKSGHIFRETKELDEQIVDAEFVEKEFNSFVDGPSGSSITFSRWREYCKRGCGYCNNSVNPDEHNLMSWFGDAPICPECTASEDNQRELRRQGEVTGVVINDYHKCPGPDYEWSEVSCIWIKKQVH